jgi:hypothetical protein
MVSKKFLEELIDENKAQVAYINKEMSRIQKSTIGIVSEDFGVSESSYNTFKYRMDDLLNERQQHISVIRELNMIIQLKFNTNGE